MTYTHTMTKLPESYDTGAIEKKWQDHWLAARTYAWDPRVARGDSFVIDTPPPTVSGTLHMGHVFSYCQADIIARFQRMNGKNVFYPMGFDDNGLPTERLVEKTKKIRATDMSREEFIKECLSVSEQARQEFRELFRSIALSVDWDQEYHTISDSSRRLSQLSFLDLVNKGHVYRKLQPMLWDPVDQTAIAQAEVVDKEMPSTANEIYFSVSSSSVTLSCISSPNVIPAQAGIHVGEAGASGENVDPRLRGDDGNEAGDGGKLVIMTTRPELLPACVALFFNPEDARYQHLKGKHATVPLFGFTVPILEDDTVEMEKGTGLMMCCTFGDEADIVKWNKHDLPTRVILNKYAKLDLSLAPSPPAGEGRDGGAGQLDTTLEHPPTQPSPAGGEGLAALVAKLQNKKTTNPDPKNPGAREIILAELEAAGLLVSKKPITHAVKTAERSGAVLELLPTHQWFVAVTDKKDALKAKAAECNWNPEWMRVRMDQWIDGLNWDWCISRQRYFGVPFPVWYSKRAGEEGKLLYATPDQLPVNPLTDLPAGYRRDEVEPDMDVMDTWATSSISPQLSAGAIHSRHREAEGRGDPASGGLDCFAGARNDQEETRFQSLFPADLRPQAHEIIRTWAFYTLVKSYLHNASVPWANLMISGWCLAEDKTKMSKSKGNVVTPVDLIQEKGTDAVRYWTATSRLGTDTAFSPDLLKIGRKLVNKLWNATQFAAIHLAKLEAQPLSARDDMEANRVSETLDRWILSRLGETVEKATRAFTTYEYADALDATNQFFWADFCDNYLELIKKRVYNEDGSFTKAQQQSAVIALYHCLSGILKLYAPFCPHVTEELYSHIFEADYAASNSLHARGTWPKTEAFTVDKTALAAGKDALEILTMIRNHKSTANVSIKFPVAMLTLGGVTYSNPQGWIQDVCGAGNVRQWQTGETTTIELAEQADAA